MLLLLLLLFGMLMHYLLFPYEKQSQKLQHFSTLTNLSKPSFSVRYETTDANHVYPEMPGLGRMDFVYEQ